MLAIKLSLLAVSMMFFSAVALADTPGAADDFSSHQWELTPYLKGTPDQIREKLNGETERLIRTVKDTQHTIQQGKVDCQDDEKAALDALHNSPTYKQTAAEKAAAEADLDNARKNGTADDRIQASSRFNKARYALEKMEHDAVATNERLTQDQRIVFEAKKNLKNFTEALDKAVAWRGELLDATRNGFMLKGPISDTSKGTLPRVTIEDVAGSDQVLAGYDLMTLDMDHPGKDREGIKVVSASKKRVHLLITGIDTKGLKVGDKTSFDRVFTFQEQKADEKNGQIYVVKPFPSDVDRLFEAVVPLREALPTK